MFKKRIKYQTLFGKLEPWKEIVTMFIKVVIYSNIHLSVSISKLMFFFFFNQNFKSYFGQIMADKLTYIVKTSWKDFIVKNLLPQHLVLPSVQGFYSNRRYCFDLRSISLFKNFWIESVNPERKIFTCNTNFYAQ